MIFFLKIQVKNNYTRTFNLSMKKSKQKEEVALRPPQVILAEMNILDEVSAEILNPIF